MIKTNDNLEDLCLIMFITFVLFNVTTYLLVYHGVWFFFKYPCVSEYSFVSQSLYGFLFDSFSFVSSGFFCSILICFILFYILPHMTVF